MNSIRIRFEFDSNSIQVRFGFDLNSNSIRVRIEFLPALEFFELLLLSLDGFDVSTDGSKAFFFLDDGLDVAHDSIVLVVEGGHLLDHIVHILFSSVTFVVQLVQSYLRKNDKFRAFDRFKIAKTPFLAFL